jgi:hypothetical protein
VNLTEFRREVVLTWASQTAGGEGLQSRGIVEQVTDAEGGKLQLQVRLVGDVPQQRLTKEMPAPHRDDEGDDPRAQLARKLYRHAHNKIANLSPIEVVYLDSLFEAA